MQGAIQKFLEFESCAWADTILQLIGMYKTNLV